MNLFFFKKMKNIIYDDKEKKISFIYEGKKIVGLVDFVDKEDGFISIKNERIKNDLDVKN